MLTSLKSCFVCIVLGCSAFVVTAGATASPGAEDCCAVAAPLEPTLAPLDHSRERDVHGLGVAMRRDLALLCRGR